jgi:hypothetical protein
MITGSIHICICKIAFAIAGRKQLPPGFFAVFDQKHAPAAPCRSYRRHHPGSPCTDDGTVEPFDSFCHSQLLKKLLFQI